MKTFEAAAFIREMRILMEITLVKDSLDYSNPGLWYTYLDWENSRMWLIDVNRNERYCIN